MNREHTERVSGTNVRGGRITTLELCIAEALLPLPNRVRRGEFVDLHDAAVLRRSYKHGHGEQLVLARKFVSDSAMLRRLGKTLNWKLPR